MTQGEANDLFQGPPLVLQEKYGHIIKLSWLVGLYAPLIPGLLIIAMVGLFFVYWVEKVSSRPGTISHSLSLSLSNPMTGLGRADINKKYKP